MELYVLLGLNKSKSKSCSKSYKSDFVDIEILKKTYVLGEPQFV